MLVDCKEMDCLSVTIGGYPKHFSEPVLSIFVRDLQGKMVRYLVYPSDTILSVKQRIEDVEMLPVAQQGLDYDSCWLEDAHTDGNKNESILQLRPVPLAADVQLMIITPSGSYITLMVCPYSTIYTLFEHNC